ncbi:hypothetical protein A3B45_05295 [Candidatus Daviesbacteria bacterium RIFCSPLOWO2_01_FULL_39_12]|uniref:DUF3048 domain-containing protein n=1 Tax=Candidatus Daviesbacteria bacterium RIFCSPLOWO2_01_FULL_39_12 TaxID=1797785 RepID=A0A1F5KQ88_9BACT|nr:MAG: hypothetical protein A3D79_02600 [Candidatus Daviesbacteria bacterium RIFCSPHIGHO2_02_FULL_39_8]OGE43020.1 MAG: hypothetical protein A3B45_05295 [Candidatus Daviesbacteria bacterium RIFCSPLOWO2_01_FULL_39_12]
MKNIAETFDGLTNLQKILVSIIVGVVFYSTSTSLSYSVFSRFTPAISPKEEATTTLPQAQDEPEEDPNEPKTESCPLNGSAHTKKAKEVWETRRPLAVMVENHTEARPQSGLSTADIIYEAVAEGGITRFMAIYYCRPRDVQVGPVRSARTYYLDWLSEYDALYAHVGGANTPGPADALGQIIRYKIKDLNQFSIGFPVFWRDYQRLGHPVATEHTMYSTTAKLWGVGEKRGWGAKDQNDEAWDENFIPWKFKDDQGEGTINKITVNFWGNQPAYQVQWEYNPSNNTYKRSNGEPHLDLNNKQQLEGKVVIVQFQRESNANDGYPGNVHLLYGTIGTGKALVFQDGNVIEGKWVKQSRVGRTKFVDSKSKEIELNKGQIWIQTVPEGSEVKY